MLLFIICAVLAAISIFFAYKADENDNCFVCSILTGLSIFLTIFSIVFAGCLICAPFDHMELKAKYEQAKTYEYNVAPEMVTKNIIQINDKILEARSYNKTIWLKGLISKKTAELELLEIPK